MTFFIRLLSIECPSKDIYIFSRYETTLCEGFRLRGSIHKSEAISSHFYHFASFLSDLEKDFCISLQNLNIEEISPTSEAKLIILDPPRLNITEKLLNKFRTLEIIMSIAENPVYLKDACIHKFIHCLDKVICSIPMNCPNFILSESAYVYKKIPSYNHLEGAKCRKLTTLIYSNQFLSRDSNYPLRRKIINICDQIFGLEFSFYGKNWSYKKVIKKILGTNQMPAIKVLKAVIKATIIHLKIRFFYPKVESLSYKGECDTKSVLLNYKTFISIENSCNALGWFTEKPLDPLIYDCLPIIISDNNLIPSLIREIPLYNKNNIPDLLLFLFSIKNEIIDARSLAIDIRKKINTRLETEYQHVTSLGILKKILTYE